MKKSFSPVLNLKKIGNITLNNQHVMWAVIACMRRGENITEFV
jgi:hypothetical protein